MSNCAMTDWKDKNGSFDRDNWLITIQGNITRQLTVDVTVVTKLGSLVADDTLTSFILFLHLQGRKLTPIQVSLTTAIYSVFRFAWKI